MGPSGANRMNTGRTAPLGANSMNKDQTALFGAVCSGFILFANMMLSSLECI